MKNKVLNLLFSRLFIVGTLLFLQLLWLCALLLGLSRFSGYVGIAFHVMSYFVVVYIQNRSYNSSLKTAWIILVLIFPLFGVFAYLLFGDKAPGQKMNDKIKKSRALFSPFLNGENSPLSPTHGISPQVLGTFHYLKNVGKFPLYNNTETRFFPIGEEMFETLINDLLKAEKYIFLEYFIIDYGKLWGEILKILAKKAKSGVEVRVMYDDMGSIRLLPLDFPKKMAKLGIKTLAFNRFRPVLSSVLNYRDHRKIAIIDGYIAYCGGTNIADEYINEKEKHGHWKDTAMRLCGVAASGFTRMFLEMWNAFCHEPDDIIKYCTKAPQSDIKSPYLVQPFCDSPLDEECIALNVYTSIISCAAKYLYIYTPYLIISNEVSQSLSLAAKKGVDVRIITPHKPDNRLVHRFTRSNYLPLLEGGVKIYEYTPGFLHAKNFVSDDEIAVVGSINLDFRSLNMHFECGVLTDDLSLICDMKKDFLNTVSLSREILTDDCHSGFFGKIFDSVARIFAPLL